MARVKTAEPPLVQSVFRRRVFYIPGYDPTHPRRYRELYRSEAADQAKISGYTIDLKSKKNGDSYGWQVDAEIEGRQVKADFDAMIWSDIVRTALSRGVVATYLQMIRTAWIYIGSGALRRLLQLRKGPSIAALYPVGMLLVQLIVALIAARVVGALVSMVVHPVAGLIAGLAMAVLILRFFRRWDNKFLAYYLMNDFAFSAQAHGANPPELEARMAAFRQTIAEALAEDWDEVLVVGHSSGAHIAVSILSDLIRAGLPERHPALSLLSVGQVMPMMTFLPEAKRLRADLHFLSAQPALTWVDVTAPGDGCAFALCDPVLVSGVAPEGKIWPLVISAAFTKTLSPDRWKELRWQFFRLHFQYLCAFDRPGDYDYFRITAGPLTLAQRYKGRVASKSRIEQAISGYTSMA